MAHSDDDTPDAPDPQGETTPPAAEVVDDGDLPFAAEVDPHRSMAERAAGAIEESERVQVRPLRPLLAMALAVVVAAVRFTRLDTVFDLTSAELAIARVAGDLAGLDTVTVGSLSRFGQPLGLPLIGAFVLGLGEAPANVVDAAHEMRIVAVVAAALTAVAAWRLATIAGAGPYALLAVALFAFDPVLTLAAGHNLPVVTATLFVLLGHVVVLRSVLGDGYLTTSSILGGGALYGMALLTSHATLPVVVGPLVVATAIGAPIVWPMVGRLLAVTAALYLPFPLAAAAAGDLDGFFGTAEGARGLPAPWVLTSGVGLVVSVLLLVAGGVAAWWLWPSRHTGRVWILAWVLASYGLAFPALLMGTPAAGQLHNMAVAAAVAVPVALGWAAGRPGAAAVRPVFIRTAVTVGVASLIVGGALEWQHVQERPDDATARLAAFMERIDPDDGVVAFAAEDDTELAPLLTPSGTLGSFDADEPIEASRYVVIDERVIHQSDAIAARRVADALATEAGVAFRATGRTHGDITVFDRRLPPSVVPTTAPPSTGPPATGPPTTDDTTTSIDDRPLVGPAVVTTTTTAPTTTTTTTTPPTTTTTTEPPPTTARPTTTERPATTRRSAPTTAAPARSPFETTTTTSPFTTTTAAPGDAPLAGLEPDREDRSFTPPTSRRVRPGSTAKVEQGQHFWSIAEEVLTNALGPRTDAQIVSYWAELIDANRDQLPEPGNPDLLYVGTVLELPPLPPTPTT